MGGQREEGRARRAVHGECSGAETGTWCSSCLFAFLGLELGHTATFNCKGAGKWSLADSLVLTALALRMKGRAGAYRGGVQRGRPTPLSLRRWGGGVKWGKPQASTKCIAMRTTDRAPGSLPCAPPLPGQLSHLLPHTPWKHRDVVLIFLKWAQVWFPLAQRFRPPTRSTCFVPKPGPALGGGHRGLGGLWGRCTGSQWINV